MRTHAPPRQPVPHRGIFATMRAFITQHSVPVYFALTFAVAWGGILLVLGPHTLARGSLAMPQALTAWALMLLGSGGVGLLMTGLVEGRASTACARA